MNSFCHKLISYNSNLYEYFVFTTLSYWFVWQAKRFLLAELMFFAGVLMSLLLSLSHKMFDESPVVVNEVENKVNKNPR